jgi:hypothetical protein
MITIVAVAACSCNLAKNIPGNVAGIVMDENGHGRGFVSVHLIDAESGIAVQVETASDTGNFMFQRVDMGTYIIKVFAIGKTELPTDCEEFKISPGKTVEKNITLISQ